MTTRTPQTGWCIYMLECADGSLYTGITCDLARRLSAHTAGTAAKYTTPRRPVTLRYTEAAPSKGAALRREAAIKGLRRVDKLALIAAVRGEAGLTPLSTND